MRIGRFIVPTGISLLVHALIIGLAALATWTITRPAPRQFTTAELSLEGLARTSEDPTPEPNPDTTPRETESTRPADAAAWRETLAMPDLATLPAQEPVRLPSIRTTALNAATGNSATDALRQGLADVKYGGRGGAGAGGATFAGVASGRASSVVFVVDCSGSMVPTFRLVMEELERSIARLAPDQRFAIVPFRDGTQTEHPLETFPRTLALVPATDQNLERAREFLRTLKPGGRSDPMAGLEPALALEPDAIFLLARSIPRTEGTWGAGKEKILAALDALNPIVELRSGVRTRPAQISAIQFLETDPLGIMQSIGATHGRGQSAYTVLTAPELGRAADYRMPSPRSIAADLDEAARLLGDLSSDHTDLVALVGFPTQEERTRVARDAKRAMEHVDRALAESRLLAEMAGLDDVAPNELAREPLAEEPRAILLGARAALLLAATEHFGPGMEGAREARFMRAARAGELVPGLAPADDQARSRPQEGPAEESPALELAISTWMLSHGLRDADPSEAIVRQHRAVRAMHSKLWRDSLEIRLASAFVTRPDGLAAVAEDEPGIEPPFAREADGTIVPDLLDPGTLLLVADAHKRRARLGVTPGQPEGVVLGMYAWFLMHDGQTHASIGLTDQEREAIVRERLRMLREMGLAREREPLEKLDLLLAGLRELRNDSAIKRDEIEQAKLVTEVRALLERVPAFGKRMVVEAAAGLVSRMVSGQGAVGGNPTEAGRSTEASATLDLAAALAEMVIAGDPGDQSVVSACEVLLVARARQTEGTPTHPPLDALVLAIATVRSIDIAAAANRDQAAPSRPSPNETSQKTTSLHETLRMCMLRAASLMADPILPPRWSDTQGYVLVREAIDMSPPNHASGSIARELLRGLDAKLLTLGASDADPDRFIAGMRESATLAIALDTHVSIGVAWALAETLTAIPGNHEMGNSEAVQACRALVAHPEVGRAPDGASRAKILLAKAQRRAGDGAGALATLLPLAEEMAEPESSADLGEQGDTLFWEVWTMTLEGMVHTGAPEPAREARQSEVARHIVRLGLIDESLGGEPWRTRLLALNHAAPN